jgi:DNA-binding FadR family transcriptional regulator
MSWMAELPSTHLTATDIPAYQSGSGQLAIKEHDAIAKAILDQNPKAAKAAMHAHIESSLKRFSPAAAARN